MTSDMVSYRGREVSTIVVDVVSAVRDMIGSRRLLTIVAQVMIAIMVCGIRVVIHFIKRGAKMIKFINLAHWNFELKNIR